jgi:hypothetical protein
MKGWSGSVLSGPAKPKCAAAERMDLYGSVLSVQQKDGFCMVQFSVLCVKKLLLTCRGGCLGSSRDEGRSCLRYVW